ncbi:hypothetical protein Tco_1556767 [Tanacetum coccineum]
MKCYSDDPLVVPIDGLHIGAKLQIVEEPVEIMDREAQAVEANPLSNCQGSMELEESIFLPMPLVNIEDKAHLTG